MKSPPPSTPQWRTPLIVFGVALLIRLAHVASIRRAPFFGLLLGDSKSYDLWAQRVAGGEWIGRDVFYQAPLYPYFLGTLYTVAGQSFAFVLFCQAVVGACSCALLADAGRRLFSPRAGLAAGLLLALYAPAIFFDGLIQKSVLDAFFLCLAIWMIARIEPEAAREVAHSPRGWVRWGALGLALGGLALTRENALALVAVLAGWALWREGPPRARLAHAAAFLGGVAIVLAPVAVRNAYVGGGFFVTTAQFGPNLYIGNHEGADGTYQALRYGRGVPEYEQRDATELAERALGRRLTPGEVSSYWRSRAIEFVVEQPGAWLRLMGRKGALLVNATEQIDTEDPAMYAEWSPPLRLLRPIGHFGVLLPLAVLGAALTWSDRRRLAVLYALALTYSASVLVFYVFARYRYPLVPLLTLFAGAGIVGALDAVRARPARLSWATAATLAAALVVANWPMGSAAEMRAVAETNLGVALQDAGRADEAIEHHQRAIEALPDYASAYSNLGNALSDRGRFDEAVRAYQKAIELEPDSTNAHYNLGTLLAQRGDPSSAIEHFEAALRVEPGSPAVHNNLGLALAGTGRADEAEAQFRQAIALDPASPAAWRNLGGTLFTKGDGPGAIEAFRRAVELNPSDASARLDLATAHNALGVALYEQGQVEEAIAELQRALEVRPDYEEARRNLAIMLERSGRR